MHDGRERIGVRVGVGANMDGATASVSVLTNHTDEGMDLLADVVQHPAFKEEDLARIRKQRLVAISQEGDSVSAVAQRVGPKLVYGAHPFFFNDTGTTESFTTSPACTGLLSTGNGRFA